MSLRKGKGGKKNRLEGAINDEISDNIMGDFMHNINHDKNTGEPSKEGKEVKKNMKEENHVHPAYSRSLPVIRNSNLKEWWISLAAFGTIVIIILLLIFVPFSGKSKYDLKLAPQAVDAANLAALPDTEAFHIGEPVYVYFGSNNPLDVKKIFIHVLNLNESPDNMKMSTMESKINPKWKNIETHFQKEYFETSGKYKIRIEDEKGKLLAEKTFFIR